MQPNLTDYCAHCGHAQTHHQNGGKCVDDGCTCGKFAHELAAQKADNKIRRWIIPALMILTYVVLLASAVAVAYPYFSTAQARLGPPAGETWELDMWKGNVTKFSEPVKMPDGTTITTTDFKMYVFECSKDWARITGDYEKSSYWVRRAVLVDDPCESGRMTSESGGPILKPLQ